MSIQRSGQDHSPTKKHNLSLAELITLAIFRFFTGHNNWKDFYRHIETYHKKDFPNLPAYENFLIAINKLSSFANLMLNGFMDIFQKLTVKNKLKFADSTKLEVCRIKREFSHSEN